MRMLETDEEHGMSTSLGLLGGGNHSDDDPGRVARRRASRIMMRSFCQQHAT